MNWWTPFALFEVCRKLIAIAKIEPFKKDVDVTGVKLLRVSDFVQLKNRDES